MEKKSSAKKFNLNDVKRIEKIFLNLDTEASSLGLALLEELKFTMQTMKQLKRDIKKNGTTVSMPQGSYNIDRANPALQPYNVTLKSYQSLIKSICEMLPDSDPDGDDFESDDL